MTMNTHNPPREFEAAVTRALERSSESSASAIPVDFAARVVASLPKQRMARSRIHAARKAAIAGMVVLAIILFALAPHATLGFASVTFYIELILLAQFGAVAYWLAVSREV
jgi:hypothetical protein